MASVMKHKQRSKRSHFKGLPVQMFARNAQLRWEAKYMRMKANIDTENSEMTYTY